MERIKMFNIGDSLPSVQCPPVSRLDLIKYAGASGDYNPIHTIDEEAKKAGLPGIIAHGMWTMGQLSRIFTPYVGEGFIKTFTVRFHSMVFLGDIITLEAKLDDIKDDEYIFKAQATKQNDDIAIKGTVVFKISLAIE